jgi:hypothetical protein
MTAPCIRQIVAAQVPEQTRRSELRILSPAPDTPDGGLAWAVSIRGQMTCGSANTTSVAATDMTSEPMHPSPQALQLTGFAVLVIVR